MFVVCMDVNDGFVYPSWDFETGGFETVFHRDEFLELLRGVGLLLALGIGACLLGARARFKVASGRSLSGTVAPGSDSV